MKTRVGVIGTSGSIMAGGWLDRFAREASAYEVVGNASLGSSHPVMVPYRLPLLDGAEMDVLIVDLCVNEQRAHNRNLNDPTQTSQILDYLRAWCAERGILLMALILPHLTDVEHYGSAVRDAWVARCRSLGLPWLDGYRLIRNACFYSRQRPRHYFINRSHLNATGAALVSEAVALTLARFLKQTTLVTEEGRIAQFRVAHLNGPLRRETSLTAERFHALSLGDVIAAETGPGEVVGIVHNLARSTAALTLLGRDALVKRLDSPIATNEGNLWLSVWSVLRSVASDGGEMLLSVEPSHPMAGQEDNDHSNALEPPADQPHRVEVAALIMRESPVTARLLRCEGGEPDLLSYLG